MVEENHINIATSSFPKNSIFEIYFPSTRKRKDGVFKFLRFEKRFCIASFSRRVSVDGRLNRRNKAAFSGPCVCVSYTVSGLSLS